MSDWLRRVGQAFKQQQDANGQLWHEFGSALKISNCAVSYGGVLIKLGWQTCAYMKLKSAVVSQLPKTAQTLNRTSESSKAKDAGSTLKSLSNPSNPLEQNRVNTIKRSATAA